MRNTKTRNFKKNRVSTKIIAMLLMAVFLVGAVAGTGVQTVQAKEAEDLGYYYMAKGQPCVFQDSEAKNLKIVSSDGNTCKVSGNKFTVTCKKDGYIKYKINGKYKQIQLIIGGNGKDTKVNKKEFDMTAVGYGKKTYHNMVDVARAAKKDKVSYFTVTFSRKKDLKDMKKYNRGIVYGSDLETVEKKYPSWQDIGGWGDDDCCWAALYYDKTSGYVFQKGFVLNSKGKVKEVVYSAYDPKRKDNIVKL